MKRDSVCKLILVVVAVILCCVSCSRESVYVHVLPSDSNMAFFYAGGGQFVAGGGPAYYSDTCTLEELVNDLFSAGTTIGLTRETAVDIRTEAVYSLNSDGSNPIGMDYMITEDCTIYVGVPND